MKSPILTESRRDYKEAFKKRLKETEDKIEGLERTMLERKLNNSEFINVLRALNNLYVVRSLQKRKLWRNERNMNPWGEEILENVI